MGRPLTREHCRRDWKLRVKPVYKFPLCVWECECTCIQYSFTGSSRCSFVSPQWVLPSACLSCVWCEWGRKRHLSPSAKRRAWEHCESLCFPVQFIRASVCVTSSACVSVGASVHSDAHAYDRGKKRSCQVRLCHWPHKAAGGHASSRLSATSAIKKRKKKPCFWRLSGQSQIWVWKKGSAGNR